MMNVEQAQKINELMTAIAEGLELQQENLNGLKTALEAYEEFLHQAIKELKDNG